MKRSIGERGKEKKSGSYVPGRGDVVWLGFSPQLGHEQAGRRPAVCLSPKSYNQKTGLGLFCPVTSKRKRYPFEVPLPEGIGVEGVVLADQIRSLDWRARRASFIAVLPKDIVREIINMVWLLLSG